MSETNEREEAQSAELEEAPPTEKELPEYRSHVKEGELALDQLRKGHTVRVRLSKAQSPLWTIDKVVYDSKLKQNVYRLKKKDGTLHPDLMQRDRLTLEN